MSIECLTLKDTRHLYETTPGTIVRIPGKVTAMVIGLDVDWKTNEIVVTIKAINGRTYECKGDTLIKVIAHPEDVLRKYTQELCPVCGKLYCLYHRLRRLEESRRIPAQAIRERIAEIEKAN